MDRTEPTRTRRRVEQWPFLTAAYGLTIEELARLPNVIMDIYIEALPAVQASQQMRAIQASAYPHMEEQMQVEIMEELKRDVRRGEEVVINAPKTIEEAQVIAGLHGVGFVIEPKPGEEKQDA